MSSLAILYIFTLFLIKNSSSEVTDLTIISKYQKCVTLAWGESNPTRSHQTYIIQIVDRLNAIVANVRNPTSGCTTECKILNTDLCTKICGLTESETYSATVISGGNFPTNVTRNFTLAVSSPHRPDNLAIFRDGNHFIVRWNYPSVLDGPVEKFDIVINNKRRFTHDITCENLTYYYRIERRYLKIGRNLISVRSVNSANSHDILSDCATGEIDKIPISPKVDCINAFSYTNNSVVVSLNKFEDIDAMIDVVYVLMSNIKETANIKQADQALVEKIIGKHTNVSYYIIFKKNGTEINNLHWQMPLEDNVIEKGVRYHIVMYFSVNNKYFQPIKCEFEIFEEASNCCLIIIIIIVIVAVIIILILLIIFCWMRDNGNCNNSPDCDCPHHQQQSVASQRFISIFKQQRNN